MIRSFVLRLCGVPGNGLARPAALACWQLERDGRVEVVGVEAGAGPDRRRYSIMAEGSPSLGRPQTRACRAMTVATTGSAWGESGEEVREADDSAARAGTLSGQG
jgi:hypothetical protein